MNKLEKKKISLTTYIIGLIILVIIIAIITLFIVLQGRKNSENQIGEEIEGEETEVAKQEIYLYDEEVKELVDKFNFNTSVQASMYKIGDFTASNMPNDLILRMAWDSITDENEKVLHEDQQEASESESQKTQTVSQEDMAKAVKNLFGNEITYTDESFDNIQTTTFGGDNVNKGEIEYKDGVYTATYTEEGVATEPYIYEMAEQALKNENTIEIYVKTAFVDIQDGEEEMSQHDLYSNYDFNTNKFENKLLSVEGTELLNENYNYNGESDTSISLEDNSYFESIQDGLKTYVYTFTRDVDTGEYCFAELKELGEGIIMESSSNYEERAEKEKALGKYLDLYANIPSISYKLYSELKLYEDNLVYVDGDLNETEEKTEVNGEELPLYSTSINYEDYKTALLKYMSEELFEQEFTTYQKEVEGKLYITNQETAGNRYEIVSMNETGTDTYEVEYEEYSVDSGSNTGNLTVELEQDSDGGYKVKSCSIE